MIKRKIFYLWKAVNKIYTQCVGLIPSTIWISLQNSRKLHPLNLLYLLCPSPSTT